MQVPNQLHTYLVTRSSPWQLVAGSLARQQCLVLSLDGLTASPPFPPNMDKLGKRGSGFARTRIPRPQVVLQPMQPACCSCRYGLWAGARLCVCSLLPEVGGGGGW